MCGIAGILRFDGPPVAPEEIGALTGHVGHRGPDATGRWVSPDGSAALGHARLAILDLSESAGQPMVSACSRYVIVFNGEIYNFIEIADELRGRGCRFRTESDTEVLLHAFEAWGADMLPRFNGMWAFAIYDLHRRSLFLSRDRFGIKPLYFYADDRLLVFASEIQAIHKFIPRRVAPHRPFLERLAAGDTSVYGEDMTFLTGVRPVQPGFNVEVRDGRIDARQWYSLKPVGVPRRFADQAARLRELTFDACRLRLRSDVPVATCLSGGIDSGSVVSVLARLGGAGGPRASKFSHRSFTAAFPGTWLDETASARSLAETNGMAFDAEIVDGPAPEEMERALRACDGPMPALAFYPIWKLYRHIRSRGIPVTLDGQGADEMLGGYYLGHAALRGAWQSGSPLWMADVYRTYGGLHPKAREWIRIDLKSVARRGRDEIDQAVKRPVKRLLAAAGLYTPKPSKLPPDEEPPVWVSPDFPGRNNALRLALWGQFFRQPLPFLLHQYDRCSMASGVECRMPFMDFRLVEYVFSLPLKSCIGGGYTKRVLREAMKGLLPEPTRRNRIKTGFNAPFEEWMKGPLGPWVRDWTASSAFRDCPYFDGRAFAGGDGGEAAGLDERVLWPKLHIAWWLDESRGYGAGGLRCP